MGKVVEVRSLVKEYSGLRAVDGISFDVPAGQVFAFLGPNGAGKTTTVEILEGLRKATSGSLRVLGFDPWHDSGALHRELGVMPQGFRFFDKVTPREAIRYYGRLFGVPTDPDRLLKRVLLTEKADSTFDKISGGQKQKLGIALALVNDPELIFLDEPTTGLDPQARHAVWELLRDLRKEGRTIFLTTHYLEEAEELADEVSIIHHGKIITHGSPAELIANHGKGARLILKGTPQLLELLRTHAIPDVRVEEGHVAVPLREKKVLLSVLNQLEASGIAWPDMTTQRDSLEQVFIDLVGEMEEGGEVHE
jgi:ABC-2 type transport system ATP-binding protein